MSYVTKHFLAEQVLRQLSQFDVSRDLDLDEREIWLRLDQVTNRLARENFLQNMRLDMSQPSPLFMTTFEAVPVQVDTTWLTSYCELPAVPVDLPHEKGIDLVAKAGVNGHLNAYIRVQPHRRHMVNNLAGDLQGQIGYWLERNRLYFTKQVTGNVVIRMVIADSRSIDSEAPYPIPADLQDQLIQEVVSFYAPGPQVPVTTPNAA